MYSSFLAIVNCKDLAKIFGVKECSNLLQYLNMILESHQQKITQNNNKTITRQKGEVCHVNMIGMNTTLLTSLNGIEKKIKTTYVFIDDTYH